LIPLESVGSPSLWAAFTLFIVALLALDLGVFHRKAHEISVKEALAWTAVWVGLALVFNVLVWHWFGAQRGLEFLTGYLIEKALSVDNIFVFLVIFSYFAVPRAFQHRVLFWGIVGALILRATFILLGAALLQRFHWVIYVFGALLVVTGIKLFVERSTEVHPGRNPVYRLFKRYLPSVDGYRGARFVVKENGRRLATPLLLVVVVVEATDVVFAVDSIPAIFAVTTDPFIVYTSNIFAILGLRALYFVLAGVMDRFHYLRVALAAVLCFVGVKMLIVDLYKVPVGVSLGVVATLLLVSVIASLLRPRTESSFFGPRDVPALSAPTLSSSASPPRTSHD
jgi:tellurite resistance protein TerC